MIHLPVLTELIVDSYRMFPGAPSGAGIRWSFQHGPTLVVGINGLGKTTLVTIILRSLTGPYDLSSDGMPHSLRVVLPERPASLKRHLTRFFAARVADGARNADATLSVLLANRRVVISRSLADLSLRSLYVDDHAVALPHSKAKREATYQETLSHLMGLSSFVDVLLVLHHMVLFLEDRPGALWDQNAQRQLLRALCLDRESASKVVELERRVQSADSQARNIHTRLDGTRGFLASTREREARSEGIFAEIEAQQELLEADAKEQERLDEVLAQLDGERRRARVAHERAKLEREESAAAIERLKYTALSRYFPKMEDTARLVLSRIMTDARCLVCDAPAHERRNELQRQLERGCCPVCGADPGVQDNVVPVHEFDQARLGDAQDRAERARATEETTARDLRELANAYDRSLEELARVRESLERNRGRERVLQRALPQGATSIEYEKTLTALDRDYRRWNAIRASELRNLEVLLDEKRSAVEAKSVQLIGAFARLTETLLVEDVRLIPVEAKPRYLQSPGPQEDRIQVPAYAAEMNSVDRAEFVTRDDPTKVSESQRELIDLAFRLALAEVFCGSSTLIVETPEASLDGVTMERVGRALSEFSMTGDNRVIATSNLTNVGIITALLAGCATFGKIDCESHVLNLMDVAIPNRALTQNRDRYEALLQNALSGGEP